MGDQPTSKPIPKFASFRPRPTDATRADVHDGVVGTGNSTPRQAHHAGKDQSPRHRHEAIHILSSGPSKTQLKSAVGTALTPKEEASRSPSRNGLFAVDVTGDVGNLTFGKIHQYNIPTYRRSALGSVLGVDRSQKISTIGGSIVLGDVHQNGVKKRDLKVSGVTGREKELRIRSHGTTQALSDNDNFVSLSGMGSRSGPTSSYHGSEEGPVNQDTHYRSIEGKAKALTAPEDPDLEFDIDTAQGAGISELGASTSDLRAQGISFTRDVDTNPTSGSSWLALIHHQDTLLTTEKDRLHQRITSAERMSTADIQLSMYEKALKQVKDETYIEILLLGMLEAGSRVWETKRLMTEWQTVLHNHPNRVTLWRGYLDFRQMNFSTFRFDEVRNVFEECLRVSSSSTQASVPEFDARTSTEIQSYILLRYTVALNEGGFSEQSIAIWQALIEYNYLRPQYSGGDFNDATTRMKSFEAFWESEVERVGEENARGWAHFALHGGDAPEPKTQGTVSLPISIDRLRGWANIELETARESALPARTMDDIGEDDPFRVILWSDVKGTLLDLPTFMLTEGPLFAFLAFCGLPSPHKTRETYRDWWQDSFTRRSDIWMPIKSIGTEIGQDTHHVLEHATHQIAFFQTTTESLFAGLGCLWASFSDLQKSPLKCQTRRLSWIRRVLKSLIDRSVGGEQLAEYFLAFEYHFFPEAVEKTARSLLKKSKTSIRLYNAFALIQHRLGNVDVAETAFLAAIRMSGAQGTSAHCGTALLWRTWIWELLERGGNGIALTRLLTFHGPSLALPAVVAHQGAQALDVSANASIVLVVQRVSMNLKHSAKKLTCL